MPAVHNIFRFSGATGGMLICSSKRHGLALPPRASAEGEGEGEVKNC